MSTPLTTSSFGTAETPADLIAVWASLPLSITEAPPPTQLVVVDGWTGNWTTDLRAALDSGAAGVLLRLPTAAPDPDDVTALAAEADRRRLSVVVESAWATDPAVAAFADAVGAELPGMALIDAVTTLSAGPGTRSLASAALDQFALLRALDLTLDSVRSSRWSADGFTIIGARGTSLFVLSAVTSSAAVAHLRLDARGVASEASLTVFDSANARPGHAEVTHADGTLRLPSLYESASRAAWRRLHQAVSTSQRVNDLAGLAADLTVLASAGPTP